MRSKASIDGHPLHPALIPFPFAFLCGALGFDLAGRVFANAGWWSTGYYLAVVGVVSALIAAIPGFIDYARTVPPRSSGHSRATSHMLLALVSVAFFALAAWFRHSAAAPPSAVVLGLEIVGALVLGAAGSMGGTLVTRNQISVDGRYAGGGRWSEATVEREADGSVVAAQLDELKPDQMKLLRVGDRRIVVARTADGYTAFDDACTHAGGSLAGGTMICGTVQCPWHGSQFDTCDGSVKAGPATRPINVYAVDDSEGNVRVQLDVVPGVVAAMRPAVQPASPIAPLSSVRDQSVK
jgi:nitrite reductase/ring-hydroxylating ferredoxin subunit/uncharacterized membrane protein